MRPLDIVVCLKSVPDPRAVGAVTLDPRTLMVKKEGVPRVISPLDKNALETALQIREKRGGSVRVVSMGSAGAAENLREALAIGADEVLFLSDPLCAGADTLATARALAAGVRYLGRFDLVLCGARSFYGSSGQVGPQVAELLGIPHVTQANGLEFIAEETLSISSGLEVGYAIVEGHLPLLVSVVKEINVPRGISLLGIVAARSKPLRVVTCADLGLSPDKVGLAGSATRMIGVFAPPNKRQGRILGGPAQEAVRTLVAELRSAGALPMLSAHGEGG